MTEIDKIKKTRLTKITAICGILIPIIIFSSIFFAISSAPWFRWTENALSDLGVEGLSAFFFNNGLIIGGILCLIFSLCLIKILKKKIGAYALLFSSLALIGIGIFPETIFIVHWMHSAAFFILITIAMIIFGITMYFKKSDKTLGAIAIFFSAIALMSPLTIINPYGIAIAEAMVCFPAFIWCMFFGIKLTITPQLN